MTTNNGKMKRKAYDAELARLAIELVKYQEWVRSKGLRIVALFEGRDAAGKGGAIHSTPATRAWQHSPRRPTGNGRTGLSSVTSPTCRRPARSSCSIGAGTTARASNG